MQPVLKRIALHGLLTALLLGLVGALFTQLASFWLASSAPPRAMPVESAGPPTPEPVYNILRYRVPLAMAAWGFAFVAVSELLVFAWRGEKKLVEKKPLVAEPDTAEKLLEELLGQADIALAKEKETGGKKPSEGDTSHAASILTPEP